VVRNFSKARKASGSQSSTITFGVVLKSQGTVKEHGHRHSVLQPRSNGTAWSWS